MNGRIQNIKDRMQSLKKTIVQTEFLLEFNDSYENENFNTEDT